jgi:hypothetical protein
LCMTYTLRLESDLQQKKRSIVPEIG